MELESLLEALAPADDPGMGVIMAGLPTAAGCWPMADDASFLPAEMTESDDFVLEEVMDILTAVAQPGHALQHGADVGVSAPAPAHVPAAPSVVKLEVPEQGAVPYAHAHGMHSMVLVEGEGSPAHGASKEPTAAATEQAAANPVTPRKSRSGRSTCRKKLENGKKGRRKGGMNIPLELLYLYHLDEHGDLLGKGQKQVRAHGAHGLWRLAFSRSSSLNSFRAGLSCVTSGPSWLGPASHGLLPCCGPTTCPLDALQAMAERFKTRTDSICSKVQSALLRKQIQRRLKPEFVDTGLLYEVRPPPPAARAPLTQRSPPAALMPLPTCYRCGCRCRCAATTLPAASPSNVCGWGASAGPRGGSCVASLRADWPLLVCVVLLTQTGHAKSRDKTLTLNKGRLKDEDLLTLKAFEAVYLTPASD